MKHVASELVILSGPDNEPMREFLILQGVRFAFRVHQVCPLLVAMTFVTSMCVFQLSRNLFLNTVSPHLPMTQYCEIVNKTNRSMGVLENKEEGEEYAANGLRRFLRTWQPEIMPTINHFFRIYRKKKNQSWNNY